MAGSVHDDNEDEDAGDKDVSPFFGGGSWKEESFLLDFLVEQTVENKYGKEWDEV